MVIKTHKIRNLSKISNINTYIFYKEENATKSLFQVFHNFKICLNLLHTKIYKNNISYINQTIQQTQAVIHSPQLGLIKCVTFVITL